MYLTFNQKNHLSKLSGIYSKDSVFSY